MPTHRPRLVAIAFRDCASAWRGGNSEFGAESLTARRYTRLTDVLCSVRDRKPTGRFCSATDPSKLRRLGQSVQLDEEHQLDRRRLGLLLMRVAALWFSIPAGVVGIKGVERPFRSEVPERDDISSWPLS